MTTATAQLNPADVARKLTAPVNAWLMAKTFAAVERERMDAIDEDLLRATEYKPAQEWTDRGMTGLPARITDHKHVYLMDDDDAAEFYADRQALIDAMGYKLPKGHCPALCAEEVQRDAEHILIHAAEVFFPGVTVDKLTRRGLDDYHKYIDLLVRLVVNSPGYVAPTMGQHPREARL